MEYILIALGICLLCVLLYITRVVIDVNNRVDNLEVNAKNIDEPNITRSLFSTLYGDK